MNTTNFKFDGQFDTFIHCIKNSLMSKEISYLLSPQEITNLLTQPNVPNCDTETMRALPEEQRKIRIKLERYKLKSAQYEKYKAKLPLDYLSYLTIFENFISFEILIHISHIRNNETPKTYQSLKLHQRHLMETTFLVL